MGMSKLIYITPGKYALVFVCQEKIGREVRESYFLLAPVLLFFLLFQYYPILKSILISFADYGLLRRSTPFVGLDNYARQLQDPSVSYLRWGIHWCLWRSP